MEGLLKQVRSRFSRKDEIGSTRGEFPAQRTASFREKRPRKWFPRQSSRLMSFKESGDDEPEYAAAVAAAAVAITSLESDDVDQSNIRGPYSPLPRTRSRIIETTPAGEHEAPESEKYEFFNNPDAEPDEMIPEKTIHPVPSIKRAPSMPKKRLTFADEMPELEGPPASPIGKTPIMRKTPTFGEEQFEGEGRIRPPRRTPSIKKTPTFGEDQFEGEGRIRPPRRAPSVKKTPTFGEEQFEGEGRIRPPQRAPSIKKTPTFGEEQFDGEGRIRPPRRNPSTRTPTFGEDARRMKPESDAQKPILPPAISPPQIPPFSNTMQPGVPPKVRQTRSDEETDADAWEREEMAKIKEKHEKLNATILEWEDKKRKKARRRLEKTESDVEKKRAKAMQKYQAEIEQIKQIADGARAQAKEKQRHEEFKVKDKANRYEKVNATILEWEEEKINKAKHKLEMTESKLKKKAAKAWQDYQKEIEQTRQIADGARTQAKDKQRNEELKVAEKANRYRATGELPPRPVCLCS